MGRHIERYPNCSQTPTTGMLLGQVAMEGGSSVCWRLNVSRLVYRV